MTRSRRHVSSLSSLFFLSTSFLLLLLTLSLPSIHSLTRDTTTDTNIQQNANVPDLIDHTIQHEQVLAHNIGKLRKGTRQALREEKKTPTPESHDPATMHLSTKHAAGNRANHPNNLHKPISSDELSAVNTVKNTHVSQYQRLYANSVSISNGTNTNITNPLLTIGQNNASSVTGVPEEIAIPIPPFDVTAAINAPTPSTTATYLPTTTTPEQNAPIVENLEHELLSSPQMNAQEFSSTGSGSSTGMEMYIHGAQNNTYPVLRVGVSEYAPFSYKQYSSSDTASWNGFCVKLWESIAKINNIQFHYIESEYGDSQRSLLAGNVDVMAMGTFLTDANKNSNLFFSHAFWYSGMSMLVRKYNNNINVTPILRDMFTPLFFYVIATIGGLFIVMAHLIWLAERDNGPICSCTDSRRRKESIALEPTKRASYVRTTKAFPSDQGTFSSTYCLGVPKAFWFTVCTGTTVGYGDVVPKTTIGRLLSSFLMLISLCLFACVTGIIASSLTTKRVAYYPFENMYDLHDMSIVVLKDGDVHQMWGRTTGCETYKCTLLSASNTDEAMATLMNGTADAFVDRTEVLQNVANQKLVRGGAIPTGFPHVYRGLTYAFPPKTIEAYKTFNNGNGLLNTISATLIALEEQGNIDALITEYFSFGNTDSGNIS